jgi:hypothetical protein
LLENTEGCIKRAYLISTDVLHLRITVRPVVGAVRARVPPIGALIAVLVGFACTLGGSCVDIVAPHVFLATAVRNVVQISQCAVSLMPMLASFRQNLMTRRAGEGRTYVAAMKATIRACLNSILKRLEVLSGRMIFLVEQLWSIL